jgi:hypothetical protein
MGLIERALKNIVGNEHDTLDAEIDKLRRSATALIAQNKINNAYISMLEARLQIASELIEEVYSQCPDENEWVKKAERWLEEI